MAMLPMRQCAVNDLRHDPDTLDPVAERTAFLRQWQQVPEGVQPWGRTVMHTPDGATYVNVDPPAPEAPDLRTVGDKVAELERTVAADKALIVEHEDRIRYLELMVHRLLNPGETERE